MMMSDVIDERIRPLVATMNACGFKTFASCEGHGFPVDGLLPYVAFYCDTEAAARLEALLRGDAESPNPQLNWGWTITGTFNPAGKLGFAMRPTRPHLIWHRYLRRSLVDDFAGLASLLLQDRESEGPAEISDLGPSSPPCNVTEYSVQYRTNAGDDMYIGVPSLEVCLKEAKRLRNVSNYMVCIEENNVRIKRWDRDMFFESNRWRRCSVDAFETLGPLPVVVRLPQ